MRAQCIGLAFPKVCLLRVFFHVGYWFVHLTLAAIGLANADQSFSRERPHDPCNCRVCSCPHLVHTVSAQSDWLFGLVCCGSVHVLRAAGACSLSCRLSLCVYVCIVVNHCRVNRWSNGARVWSRCCPKWLMYVPVCACVPMCLCILFHVVLFAS